ncbi:MAG: hypothetical protein WC587_00205 [Candidatus Paceibacterota bacterium]
MRIIILIFNAFRDLIIRYLPRMRKKGGFAFIVHPRNMPDVYRKYPFFKILPISFLEWFLRHYWPVILSKTEGLKDKNDKEVSGWIITIPLTAEQMLKDKNLAKKKILQAIKLAEKMGAKIIGLGAFIVSITNGGKDIINHTKTFITTGNSLMAGITVSAIKDILKNNPDKKNIAIIGATTFIGSAVSKLLAENNFDSLILIGKTIEHINKLKDEINEVNKSLKTTSSVNIGDIIQADIIVIATSAQNIGIKSEYIKINAVIYDTSQPKSIPEEILNKRKDIKYIEGGLVKTPGVNYHFNFGIEKETAFACLGETMILAAENMDNHYSIGDLDTEKIMNISKLAEQYKFKTSSL